MPSTGQNKGARPTSHTDKTAGTAKSPGHGGESMYLGIEPRKTIKVYLTVEEMVTYSIVRRKPGQPKVTVAEVVKCINDLQLDHHAIRDGKLVYDPVPIRKALSTIKPRSRARSSW